MDLKLDQQSTLGACNPFTFQSSTCNYLQGGNMAGTTGTMTGSINDNLNQEFKGLNPKGTWKILWRDFNPNGITATLGEITLEVKTVKRFAKE